jgi:diguanylate cyclase (GGDEF)-like protein
LRTSSATRLSHEYAGPALERYVTTMLESDYRDYSRHVVELSDGRVLNIINRPLPDGGIVGTHEDITEIKRAEAQIRHMARHDPLTDLPNRTMFKERVDDALRQLPRGDSIALLYLDLDHFKTVNDTLGHLVGDDLLKAVAERLRSTLRSSEVLARLGGDEFAILQTGGANPTEVTALARRILEVLNAPYVLNEQQLVIGASMGIAMGPADGGSADVLLKDCDLALYRAKADGRGIYRFFEPEMDARMQARRMLELDLRRALAQSEFELFYQPVLNIARNEVTGFEALVRWRHPERGLVPPLEFIPLAEEIGLIVPLGEWILRQACLEAAGWPEPIRVAVNLSPNQFKNKRLADAVIDALTAAKLAPQRLELEITEGVLLVEHASTLATLHQLRGIGVHIAMDDFGTGYSSLSYLRSFPFDKIKIDGSFIRSMAQETSSLAIIRAVIGLSTSLGMTTTAEGVETQAQFDQVRAEGCDEVQGYLISKPRPASEIGEFLVRRPRQPQAAEAAA